MAWTAYQVIIINNSKGNMKNFLLRFGKFYEFNTRSLAELTT